MDENSRELWEIDENLMRAELTPAQEADHLKRRKELWSKVNSGTICPTNTGRGMPKEFASETSEALGISKRHINHITRRAENIAPEALFDVQGIIQ